MNIHCISIVILPIHANTCCLESLDWNSGVLRLVEKGQDLKAITDVIADLRRRHKKATRIHLSLVETVRAGLDETTTLFVWFTFLTVICQAQGVFVLTDSNCYGYLLWRVGAHLELVNSFLPLGGITEWSWSFWNCTSNVPIGFLSKQREENKSITVDALATFATEVMFFFPMACSLLTFVFGWQPRWCRCWVMQLHSWDTMI